MFWEQETITHIIIHEDYWTTEERVKKIYLELVDLLKGIISGNL